MTDAPQPSAPPQSVLGLIQRFSVHIDEYRSGKYNETQLRREFLDPFWKALGWDVDNTQGYAWAYRDVIHEDEVKVGGATKAPDYGFRIGQTLKFFLEAKKPSVWIQKDISAAYQVRRYAWNAKLALSVLSDFEEFAVYDARVRPSPKDDASTARVFYCRFDEYEKHWGWIYSTFSKEAVLKGAFDKYADSKTKKRGTTAVDDAFLEDIEGWRKALATNLALRNARLTQRELNFAVQRIIDRIIFLRICEDRGIEKHGRLQTIADGADVYGKLTGLFRQADDRYNSGLFHFTREKERGEEPDEVTLRLKVDDKVLKDILRGLYYPRSPYEFKVFPADILGQVYERFLGKTIRLTEGHQAKVEEKPEVRKAGGVYYTPTYIVDYIVKNTVGTLLGQGTVPASRSEATASERTVPFSSNSERTDPDSSLKTKKGTGTISGKAPKLSQSPPDPARAAKLKILDPACGSGSFLIGAYQYLLDWHRDWYSNNDPQKWSKGRNPTIYEIGPSTGSGQAWALTLPERKRILLDNIHGVDIDSQAVEVTKLSLLLKVLEGQTEQTVDGQLKMFHERALPDLGRNIKCGNSLIGPDFYKQKSLGDFSEDERLRVNVFDWNAEFPEIIKSGGFDAVIGNPPYIRIQTMQDSQPQEVQFFGRNYRAASQGNYDIYVVFVDRGLVLLNTSGRLGFILPNKFFNSQYGQPLREFLSTGRHLDHIVHFGDQQVFSNATTYTCLLFLSKAAANECTVVKATDLETWRQSGAGERGKMPASAFSAAEWNIEVGGKGTLRARLPRLGKSLGEVAHIFVGLQTSADKVFVIQNRDLVESKILRPFLTTGGLRPYQTVEAKDWLIFPYEGEDGPTAVIPPGRMRSEFPKTWLYLKSHEKKLRARDRGKLNHDRWYAFGRSQNLKEMSGAKLVIQVTAVRPIVIFDELGLCMTGGGAGPFYGIRPRPAASFSIGFLLGILNSNFFGWIVRGQSTPLRGGYFKYSKQYIESTPIPSPSKAAHDRMVALVEQMLELNKKLPAAHGHEKTALERQIAATDSEIDALVYELYGLTPDEIKIVEGKS